MASRDKRYSNPRVFLAAGAALTLVAVVCALNLAARAFPWPRAVPDVTRPLRGAPPATLPPAGPAAPAAVPVPDSPGVPLPGGASQGATQDYLWHTEIVDGANNVGAATSLALDAADHPHISYADGGNYALKYAYYDGATWITATVDGVENAICGGGTSLALDAAGRPHISYCACGYNGCSELRYARYDGTSWLTQTVDYGWGAGAGSSIALDAAGRPRISYAAGFYLRYAAYDGAAWITTTIGAGGDATGLTSLVLDAADRPRISYGNNYYLRYAYNDGAGWQVETVSGIGHGNFTSLALDTAGRPHIAYQVGEMPVGLWLAYAYYDGQQWQCELVDTGEYHDYVDIGFDGALALDDAGHPHISYGYSYLWPGPNGLRYARYDGAAWHIEEVGGGSGGATSLALDAEGRPHISYGYYNGSNQNLMYAYRSCTPLAGVTIAGSGGLPVGITGFYTTTPAPYSATLPITLAWSNGQVSPTGTYSWTTVGVYPLAVTATNPCSQVVGAAFTVTVFCQPLLGAAVAGPPTLRAGQSGAFQAQTQPITASRPLTFTWDNGAVGAAAVYSWTVPGVYTVSVTATNVCGTVQTATTPVLVRPWARYLPVVVRRE